jgi:hypothetical protein
VHRRLHLHHAAQIQQRASELADLALLLPDSFFELRIQALDRRQRYTTLPLPLATLPPAV